MDGRNENERRGREGERGANNRGLQKETERAGEDAEPPQVMATPKNIVGAPKGSVAATRNVKSKIQRHKAYTRKAKGSGWGCGMM